MKRRVSRTQTDPLETLGERLEGGRRGEKCNSGSVEADYWRGAGDNERRRGRKDEADAGEDEEQRWDKMQRWDGRRGAGVKGVTQEQKKP